MFGLGLIMAALVYLSGITDEIRPKYPALSVAACFIGGAFSISYSFSYVMRNIRGQATEFRVDEAGMEGMAMRYRLPFIGSVWSRVSWKEVKTVYAMPNTGFVSIRFSRGIFTHVIFLSSSAIPVDVRKEALHRLQRHRPDLRAEIDLALNNIIRWLP
jgi:hypothetical protein